ncbi:ornithine cyclodeaminase family protein [Sphingomonas sp. MG17]|uniref:Ornithine cyclodeaminase family protein n=1 Tax=Sphingomonas tagetis TaxID=2949092 RepID=A0A9X2HJ45_9SPHN|nr:ornithine cyclodeaminase family protein [Sphingomonas tagetis]MCP3729876.1 ornithine cyclodeaminase family protein [Sphingomonas tagetis]
MPGALLLNEADVTGLLDIDELLEALAAGFRAISADEVAAPPRGQLHVEGAGQLLLMPAHAPGLPIGTKLVTVFPGNHHAGIPSHFGLIVLMDAATGTPLALVDGNHITAMRTAGASLLAAKLLARPDSRVLTILGSGVQAQAHLELMTRHFDLETIFIGSDDHIGAARLAGRDFRARVVDDYEAAVRQSDMICLCSSASQPLIRNGWLRPGQHVSSVGFAPPGGELDPAIAANHKLYVEAKIAFAPAPAGCAELTGIDPADGAELGEVLLGRKPGRESPDEITVYKAMGHAIEDLVTADLVYRRAVERSIGQTIQL